MKKAGPKNPEAEAGGIFQFLIAASDDKIYNKIIVNFISAADEAL